MCGFRWDGLKVISKERPEAGARGVSHGDVGARRPSRTHSWSAGDTARGGEGEPKEQGCGDGPGQGQQRLRG